MSSPIRRRHLLAPRSQFAHEDVLNYAVIHMDASTVVVYTFRDILGLLWVPCGVSGGVWPSGIPLVSSISLGRP